MYHEQKHESLVEKGIYKRSNNAAYQPNTAVEDGFNLEDDFKIGNAPKAQGGNQAGVAADTTIGLDGTIGAIPGGQIQPLGGNITAMNDDSLAIDLVAGLSGQKTA